MITFDSYFKAVIAEELRNSRPRPIRFPVTPYPIPDVVAQIGLAHLIRNAKNN